MKAERNGLPSDPFIQFITESLDLHAIEGLNATEIGDYIQGLLDIWLNEGTELTPADYLDETQEKIRRVLPGMILSSPMTDMTELAGVDRSALEYLIRFSITLAFAFQAELSDDNKACPDDDFADARRLRRMLSIALVYARREAMQDDLIANRIVRDSEQLLDSTERLR